MSTYLNDTQLPFKYTTAAIVPINTVIFDWDTQEMTSPGISLQVSALGTTGVLTPEWSCDEVNWSSGWLESVSSSTAGVSTITSTGMYLLPTLARFVRIRMTTATTAGSTALAVTLSMADFRVCAIGGGSVSVYGASAHDSAINASPLRLAGRAVTANYTAVSSNDTADLITTLVGAQINKPFSIPEADWQYAAAAGGIINTTDVAAKAAGAAGIRNYVTGMTVRNTNAVATEFVVKDGATVIYRTQLPASMAVTEAVQFPTPLKGTAATALNIACITTGAAVYANLQGYQAP